MWELGSKTVAHPDEVEDIIGELVADLDDEAAQTYGDAMYAAHQTCVGPYEPVAAAAAARLSETG